MRNAASTGHTARTLLLLAASATIASCGTSEGNDAPAAPGPRRIATTLWDTVFVVGSSARDSSLLLPFRPVAGGAGVYLPDFYGNRVLSYDSLGHLAWSYGRKGAGPGEFRRIRDVKVDAAGQAWVLDQRNLRLTVITASGQATRMIPLAELPANPEGVVPLRGGDAIVVLNDTLPLVRITPDGHVAADLPFPWAQFRTLHPLATQLATAAEPRTGRWVAAFQNGNGFFRFRDSAPAGRRNLYVENVPFPEIQVTRTGNSVESGFRNPPVSAAESISLSPTRVYVLFGGRTGLARRIVDVYSLDDGRYIESVRLPRAVDHLAWGNGGFYVTYSDPYPHLALWRPHGERLR
jgi:hypothetical protein